jgi:hypothetical protein
MKLTRILLENDWRPLSSAEVQDNSDELFKMIDNAYAPLGGHPNVKSSNDINTAADGYEVIDLDDDPEDDAAIMTKKRPGGTKLVGMGHDGTKPARSAAVSKTVSTLNKNGYYIEVSGKILDILKAKGVAIVNDEETVRNALKGKEIVWHEDGSYDRVIGGQKHRKVMMGKPNVN